jgi:nitrogen regulatory protein PII
MTQYIIKQKDLEETQEYLSTLEKHINELIVDLHDVKGAAAQRQLYVYYRTLVWNAKYTLRDKVKVTKDAE